MVTVIPAANKPFLTVLVVDEDGSEFLIVNGPALATHLRSLPVAN